MLFKAAGQDTIFKDEHRLAQSEILAWLRLARTESIGPITFYKLLESCGSASAALEALPALSRRGGRKKPLTPPSPSAIEREFEALQKMGGHILTAFCPEYPQLLRACDDAPPVLSVLGNPALMQKQSIAMVGARNASLNGRKLAEKLARDLGQHGQIITSGLARGIDTAAHKGALESGTIAVVAGGIDVIYPEENTSLYEQIKEKGCVMAESPLGQKPFAQSFPRRNRIVSGLSTATIVVEATLRSGSLITARLAGEQGRDVLAIPGSPLDPRAEGPNALIRDGATLIRNANDVLECLQNFSGHALKEPFHPPPLFHIIEGGLEEPPEDARAMILSNLSFTPIMVDELLRACHLTIPVLQTLLLELELGGRIKRLPGNKITLLGEG